MFEIKRESRAFLREMTHGDTVDTYTLSSDGEILEHRVWAGAVPPANECITGDFPACHKVNRNCEQCLAEDAAGMELDREYNERRGRRW